MTDETTAPETATRTDVDDERSFDRLTAWTMLAVGTALTALTASGWLISTAAARIVLALLFSVLVACGAYLDQAPRLPRQRAVLQHHRFLDQLPEDRQGHLFSGHGQGFDLHAGGGDLGVLHGQRRLRHVVPFPRGTRVIHLVRTVQVMATVSTAGSAGSIQSPTARGLAAPHSGHTYSSGVA
uniref:hypothetical protein n=1 Tax=Amycolatopsis sp. CA-096443 TaxID=3239919 RepID=UPI003F49B09E